MKSQSLFKKGLLWGLVALLVVGGVTLAGLVTAQQLNNPFKDDFPAALANQDDFAYLEGDCQPICNQRGTLTVFSSSKYTTGHPADEVTGRSAMHAICRQEDPASHFCSIQEIEHAWATTGVYFEESFGPSWVDTAKLGSNLNSYHEDINKSLTSNWRGGGPPSNNEPKNCNSWTSDGRDVEGLYIERHALLVGASLCVAEFAVTCCK